MVITNHKGFCYCGIGKSLFYRTDDESEMVRSGVGAGVFIPEFYPVCV